MNHTDRRLLLIEALNFKTSSDVILEFLTRQLPGILENLFDALIVVIIRIFTKEKNIKSVFRDVKSENEKKKVKSMVSKFLNKT